MVNRIHLVKFLQRWIAIIFLFFAILELKLTENFSNDTLKIVNDYKIVNMYMKLNS
jgi:hypothetical protein